MWHFVESVPGTKVWPAQRPLFLFPYPKTNYHSTFPENVAFCGKDTRYRNIERTLAEMLKEGSLKKIGGGRYTFYVRVQSDDTLI